MGGNKGQRLSSWRQGRRVNRLTIGVGVPGRGGAGTWVIAGQFALCQLVQGRPSSGSGAVRDRRIGSW